MKEPVAKKILHKRILHGEKFFDYYHWLRDDKRDNINVIKYLEHENNYVKHILTSQNNLKNLIFKEITDRIPLVDFSIPYIKGNYCYQIRYEYGNEYPICYRKLANDKNNKWFLIIDTNQRASINEFYSIGSLSFSPDNVLLAISEDFVSRLQYTIKFFNISGNYWYVETLYNTSSEIVWDKNSRMIFYIKNHSKTLRSYQIWCHRIGTLQSQDIIIYEEQDESFYLTISKTTSERFILICSYSNTTTEIRLIDNYFTNKYPEIFLSRSDNHKYSIDHYNNKFVICSNRIRENFNLYYTENMRESNWKDLININEDANLENFQLFLDWIVVEEKQHGLTNLRQISWKNKNIEKSIKINSNDPIYNIWLEHNYTPLNNKLIYGYSSMTTPNTIFELNMDTGNQMVLKQIKIKNFNSCNYKSEYRLIPVRDGTKIPVSLVYNRKYHKLNKNPALIYGYGAYGNSIDSDFCISRLSLLDRGFIYIIIHIRGGGELGQKWHDSGKLLNKMNSFTDFIDVTNHLLSLGIGKKDKLYAMGGSAGGLLIGTVINLAPKLFHGVIAQVPFVDVITTMLDNSIPLTTNEYNEWGNPEYIDFYNYMKKYSPYDNVEAKDYPNIFVTSGFYDSQVQYWEPAKWVAKLRELKTNKNLLLLSTDMNAGHSGKSGRYEKYKSISLELTFIIALSKNFL
ncbi:S9 family peptidase [Pantoea sp. SoEX]|uniref:S9 family peptidase n=1 Tax=Pantoea sp. SoEX TaxID=2576763 RepID=UPI001356F198|nr:prolyl oligopeptidase family serine peptidase [Pantoea sp. SoEX]MXP50918.1 oligopeptidase B [Pantoea sp. SoEX]